VVADPDSFNPDPDSAFQLNPDPDAGFWWPKIEKWQQKKFLFFDQLQFTYPYASIKDVQSTGEAFSPQKRTSNTSEWNVLTFFYFRGSSFALLDSDLIRIQESNTDYQYFLASIPVKLCKW
jgi:hypothetical protein